MLIAMPFLISRPVKSGARELRALVDVEDLRLAVLGQRLLQRLDAESHLPMVIDMPPFQRVPAVRREN
jgi:hypothetical protein